MPTLFVSLEMSSLELADRLRDDTLQARGEQEGDHEGGAVLHHHQGEEHDERTRDAVDSLQVELPDEALERCPRVAASLGGKFTGPRRNKGTRRCSCR